MEVFSSIPHSSINNANRQYMVESGIKEKNTLQRQTISVLLMFK